MVLFACAVSRISAASHNRVEIACALERVCGGNPPFDISGLLTMHLTRSVHH